MSKIPNQRWFKVMDRFHSRKFRNDVINDIESNSNIKNKVKDFYNSFIDFACLERMYYGADIEEELDEYLKRKRMYSTNVKKWQEIQKAVFKRDDYTCKYCGKRGGKLEVDHVIPFSKGGSDDLSNLVTSCRHCNAQKHDKTLEEFMKWKKEHE